MTIFTSPDVHTAVCCRNLSVVGNLSLLCLRCLIVCLFEKKKEEDDEEESCFDYRCLA